MDTQDFLTVKEVALLLDVKPATIYQLVWMRKIPYYKPLGKRLFFRKDEIIGLMQQGRRSSISELETKAATTKALRGNR